MELIPLTARDGATADARFFAAPSSKASVLVIPALGVNARSYDRLGEGLASLGISTLVGESRGGERSSVRARRGVDYGYAQLLDDVRIQREWLEKKTGGIVHLFGHSLGGHLALLSAPPLVARGTKVMIVASGTVHWRHWPLGRRLGVWSGTQLARGISWGLGFFPGHRLGFGGLQGKSVMMEWAGVARHGRFESLVEGSLEGGLGEVELELLAVHVKGDTMAPRSATEGLVRKVPKARVRWEDLVPPARPQALNAHFRWMREPEAVAELVSSFLSVSPAPRDGRS